MKRDDCRGTTRQSAWPPPFSWRASSRHPSTSWPSSSSSSRPLFPLPVLLAVLSRRIDEDLGCSSLPSSSAWTFSSVLLIGSETLTPAHVKRMSFSVKRVRLSDDTLSLPGEEEKERRVFFFLSLFASSSTLQHVDDLPTLDNDDVEGEIWSLREAFPIVEGLKEAEREEEGGGEEG